LLVQAEIVSQALKAEVDPGTGGLLIAGALGATGAYNLILNYLEGLQLRYTSYRSAGADAGEQTWTDWFWGRMRVSFVRFAALSIAAILTHTVRFRPTPVGFSVIYALNEFTPLGGGFLYGLASITAAWQNNATVAILNKFVTDTATALLSGDSISLLQNLSGAVAAVAIAGFIIPRLRRRGGALGVAALGLQWLVYALVPDHFLMNAYYWLTVLAPATLNEDITEWPRVLTESKLIRWLMNDLNTVPVASSRTVQSALLETTEAALPLAPPPEKTEPTRGTVVTQIALAQPLVLHFVDAAEQDDLTTYLQRSIVPAPPDDNDEHGGRRSTADDGGLS